MATRWDPTDLIRRVNRALNIASQAVRMIVASDSAHAEGAIPLKSLGRIPTEKVVAETAMLLLCVAPIRTLDERIQEQFDIIATLLAPLARHTDVLAAICLEPGLARDHAVAHIILSHLGYPDRNVDHLLSESLAMGDDYSPERLPHRWLEQKWLAGIWGVGKPFSRPTSRILADSMLGREMDVLGAPRFDIYAFTHAVMYASDLGRHRIALPRSSSAIVATATAALAYSLDTNDFDLSAELVLTWPMLRLAWSPAATFAFQILASVEDNVGFLPGLTFDVTHYRTLTADERSSFALTTSYHTAYIMGFLCANILAYSWTPPIAIAPARRSRGAGGAILSLVSTDGPTVCWRAPFSSLAPCQQDSVAPLLLALLLRRARTAGDLHLLREVLEIALAYDLIDGPAPMQAVALLRRSQVLRL